MNITSLDQLAKELQNRINLALKVNVAPVITEQMSETIKEETFVEYTPTEYIRLGDEGGLSDIHNIHTENIDSNTISIRNETQGNENYQGYHNGNIDGIIVSGHGYAWTGSRIYKMQPFPRDFYGGTVRRLQGNKLHIIAMKKGLESQGLTVN